MSLVERFISRLVPYDCLGCGGEGRLLCAACLCHIKPPSQSCYRCRQPGGTLTCAACQPKSRLYQVQAAAVYEGLAKALVWKLKFGHAQGASRELAALMAPLLANRPKDCLIVPVPTATSRVRQRGYDQARLLARELAGQLRLPCVDALVRQNQAHQVGAGREQRLNQLAEAFRVRRARLAAEAHIILVDDVVTTGATLEAAAAALHQAGVAGRIEAITFAQPAS